MSKAAATGAMARRWTPVTALSLGPGISGFVRFELQRASSLARSFHSIGPRAMAMRGEGKPSAREEWRSARPSLTIFERGTACAHARVAATYRACYLFVPVVVPSKHSITEFSVFTQSYAI